VSLVITENSSSTELKTKSAEGLLSELSLYLEFNNKMVDIN